VRIAIVGSKGQVGWELTRRAPMFGHEVLAWDQDELDITDATAVDQTLTASGAAVVINAAAYTAVDRAEQEPELAFAVNRDGPAHLAAACARLNIPLLHISTDYVFDGARPALTSRTIRPRPWACTVAANGRVTRRCAGCCPGI
jgi:dTDP-4-dehydrorhamnose reductase